MHRGSSPERDSGTRSREAVVRRSARRAVTGGGIVLAVIATAPGTVSAHGGEHSPPFPQWYGLIVLLLGFGILGGTVVLERRERIATTEHALVGVFLGVLVAALGGIMIVQLSPIDEYSASSMPFPRAWYPVISLTVGSSLIIASTLLGQFRWPRRPRYSVLGILLGLWVAYPAIIRGPAEYQHPVGYVIALAVPVVVVYILWRDGRDVLGQIWQDPVARRFGLGIGGVMLLFFVFSTGLVTLVPETGLVNGHDVIDTPAFVHTQPFVSPLVMWPAVEVWLPQIPLSAAISLGVLLMIVLLGGLVAINAMLAAFQWCYAGGSNSTQSTAGAAALVGPNACGCCGPMVAQLGVVLLGPSAAAPLYWLFVDFSSPVGSFFFVASVGLLTGGFVYAANAISLDQCTGSPTDRSQAVEQLEGAD